MKYKRIKPRRRKFKSNKVLYIFLLFLFIGVGYAALTTSLSINGTTNVATNSWNIHFANLHVQGGSVEGNAPTMNTNSISYSATLAQPGDFYEFSVDVKNDGTLPGKVSLVNLTGNSTNYLSTSFTYSNGTAVTIGDIINAGKSRRLTIKTWIPSDIDTSLLPTTDTPITLTFNLQYIQSEEDAPPDATDQLLALANTNSCMSKYNGQVTDKVGVTEQATQVYFDKCSDKRNVIFNNMCWQVIRTTETGGIKMIYNGEPEGGKCLSTRGNHTGIVQTSYGSHSIDSSYLYGSSFTYNKSTNQFTLIDTFTETWNDLTYERLLSKFTCKSSSDTCTTIYEINSYASNTNANVSYYTITDTNYAQIGTSSYNATYSSITMVGYMHNTISSFAYYNAPTSNSLKGNDVTYENGVYTLLPAEGESELSTVLDATHHYTCNTTSSTCDTVRFYYHNYYYIELKNAKKIDDVLNEMLYSNEVNKYNSSIKGIIDSWYAQNLTIKTNMLEDTVFCNARNMTNQSTNGWNKNGNINTYVDFGTNMLTCNLKTDQFSTNNNIAKLNYPVGLLQSREREIIFTDSLMATGVYWWELTPNSYSNANSYVEYVFDDGSSPYFNYTVISNHGVRPVISLAPGNTIASGLGSESDPWVIQE